MGRITINPYEKGPRKSLKKDIKTQDKEIEITSNGITEVTPDAGFTALNSVNVNVNVPQSGGTELEGEYFLVKPNGRYWKTTIATEGFFIDYSTLSEDQINALLRFYEMIAGTSVICGAAVCYAGSPSDSDLRADMFQVAGRSEIMIRNLHMIKEGYGDLVDSYEFNSGFCRIWKENYVKTSMPSDNILFNEFDFVSYIKQLMSMEGMEATDEEIMSIISERFMFVPATEEEYKVERREN